MSVDGELVDRLETKIELLRLISEQWKEEAIKAQDKLEDIRQVLGGYE